MTATMDDRHWLAVALDLSRLAPPTPTNYAVGAVVVDRDGVLLATGHTGEAELRTHAEEAALSKLTGRDLTRSTVYSTLEPCTTRVSRPATCTDLILTAGIRRVVIALREPTLFADCHGVETLRAAGVEVVEIGEMGPVVQEINAHVLQPNRGEPVRVRFDSKKSG